jgi:hypothetical protein
MVVTLADQHAAARVRSGVECPDEIGDGGIGIVDDELELGAVAVALMEDSHDRNAR